MATSRWRTTVAGCATVALSLWPFPLPAQGDTAELRTLSDSLVAVKLVQLLGEHSPTLASLAPMSGPEESATSRAMRDLISTHMQRYTPPDSLTPVLVREYLRLFTGEELRSLYTFVASPLGLKYRLSQRALLAAATKRTSELLDPHRAELQQRTLELITKAASP